MKENGEETFLRLLQRRLSAFSGINHEDTNLVKVLIVWARLYLRNNMPSLKYFNIIYGVQYL